MMLINKVRSLNWDELLAYDTVKTVTVKDWRLGLIRVLFVLGILGYVLGYQLLMEKQYLKVEPPVGTIRTSILQPQNGSRRFNLSYCGTSPPDKLFFAPCLDWDETDALFPIAEQSAMHVTTRVTLSLQEKTCTSSYTNCTAWKETPEKDYFIVDIERFTILMDHTMSTPTNGIAATGKSLPGTLLDSDDNQIDVKQRYPGRKNTFGVLGKHDILELQVFLDAAKVKLDDESTSSANESWRYSGCVLLVFISYDNTFSFNTNNLRYKIKVVQVKNTEFKAVEPVHFPGNETYQQRMIKNRHGVRLLFLQIGTLGKFDFQNFLLTIVSGLGLLAFATIIVDILASKILPEKDIYNKYLFEETVNFAEIKKNKQPAQMVVLDS
eukprot:TRINITY_DN5466_c0_g1_i1.p1 TRINITY_DN5466_c0_g1~~TRINITY_DN5466_c0_g1_i1.p1  ORF type:complete len:381 (-),score=65.76 TRINITY_DN5466_c0_g1_i1:114-1256(-)